MSPSKHGCFVTATGTDAGKTLISVALIHALRAAGRQVCAVKPIETGCDPLPQDAIALAEACGRPQLATNQEFWRGPIQLTRIPRAGGGRRDAAAVVGVGAGLGRLRPGG